MFAASNVLIKMYGDVVKSCGGGAATDGAAGGASASSLHEPLECA